MEEKLDLELVDPEPNQVDINRIKDLSQKTKAAYEERDAKEAARVAEEQARLNAEKERDYYKGFNTVASKYQGASDYQDQILEKVKAGYDIEDAAVAVLVKEGKYTPPPEPQGPRENPAGGSATNSIKATGEKTIADMTQAEKRAELDKVLGRT